MIVAFLAFGVALGQVLLDQEIVSSQKKFIVAIVITVLSGIPLTVQLVILSGELARARKYSTKLLLHRMMMTIAGDYGTASNLLVKQYRWKTIGDYSTANGFWRCVLYLGHGLAKFYGMFPFGDAFSGVFTIRYTSVALWMDDAGDTWDGCEKPVIEEDVFQGPALLVKDVRDLSLTVEFSPTEQKQCTDLDLEEKQSKMVHCHVFATGSRDDPISKLYYESLWRGECRIKNARELCTLMEILSNDSFVVKCRPPDAHDQILPCEEELSVIVRSILREESNKKLNAKRVYGMSYV